MARYPIPARRVREVYKQSNSRFIATLDRADSVEQARELLQEIRDEMPDASHHVYAFRVGYGASIAEGVSDDGEPSGTSGPPILAVLRGADVGDCLIVVTRYFGGTKLGTGGLVSAYSAAAKAALDAMKTELKIDRRPCRVVVSYKKLQELEKMIEQQEIQVADKEFSDDVALDLLIPDDCFDQSIERIRDLLAGAGSIDS
jgi:uncharacterized YigZ family protein